LHFEEVLSNGADLTVYLRRVGRVTVLKREAVGVVDELSAVGNVVFEETGKVLVERFL